MGCSPRVDGGFFQERTFVLYPRNDGHWSEAVVGTHVLSNVRFPLLRI